MEPRYTATMKAKIAATILALVFLSSTLSFAGTDDPPTGNNALRKLGRGLSNVIFGVTEVPNQISGTTAAKGGAAGATYGTGKGFLRWICREVVGVYEVVTFPLPMGNGYKPVMKPEFPTDDYEP
jgi:putative exosortase-associated protein (TIGR04073 family)